MDPLQLIGLVAGLAFAGLAKGVTGMGLPLLSTPILAGVFGPRTAVLIVAIPVFAANSLLMLQGLRGRQALLRGLGPLFAASIVGTAFGTLLLAQLDQRTFAILITVMVLVFLLRGDRLLGDDPEAVRAQLLGPVVCFAGGILQGTTSISAPLIGSYLHARRLAPGDFVFISVSLYQVNSVVQLVGYALQDLYTPDILAFALLGLVPTLGTMMVGIALRGHIDARRFRQLIVALLVVSVANLLWRSFFA